MCGITGIWSYQSSLEKLNDNLKRATNSIPHRGPDSDGHWFDETVGIALGHRRLAIVDISPQGHQPMLSPSQRFVIVFNGEIYNHQSLRKELATSWCGHSDTETLLVAIEQWGLKKTLQKIYGMFAFSIFDRQEKTLTLARDRMGEKPLYYGFKDSVFLFSSELKSIFSMPSSPFFINKRALNYYFKHTYMPEKESILQGIYKLSPGHMLTLNFQDYRQGKEPQSTSYYDVPPVTDNQLSFEENKNTLALLLKEVIQEQMVADVSLGAFLSGGIDSSLIVSMMQSLSSIPIKTFSIGFKNEEFNEAHHAKAVAQHLKTDHTELYVNEKEAQDVIPLLPHIYDEPFADSSQIPTFLVSQLARQHVTVSLSGDAGDELFGGYDRYALAGKFYKNINWIPPLMRQGISLGIMKISPSLLNSIGNFIPRCPLQIGHKLHKVSQVLAEPPQNFYNHLMSCWHRSPTLFNDKIETPHLWDCSSSTSFFNSMMRMDMSCYLPNDILVKVDRAAMAASLETRIPFLDARIINFSQSLPFHHKFSQGKGKYILRELLYTYVPRELRDRPKKGFGVPVGEWMCGALKEWCQALLDTLKEHPYLDSSMIMETWNHHQRGTVKATSQLWSIFMYLSWYERYKSHVII